MKNRIIKFRAWSDTEKCYFIKGDDYGTTHDLDVINYYRQGQPIILEQFTGLQDKNGVDIYEGDIVSGVLYKDYTEHTGKVLFDYNGYMIVTKEKSITLKLTELLTVIGNIHEETK